MLITLQVIIINNTIYDKMKHINDLTIREFYEFRELIENNANPLEILPLFGVSVDDLSIQEFQDIFNDIINQKIQVEPVKDKYIINSIKYHPELNIKNIKAAQFIDLQTYTKDEKYEKILSVFMLPISKKGWFSKEDKKKYNTGYDIFSVQENLLNHMRIGDAIALTAFFFELSIKLLPIIRDSLMIQSLKEVKKLKSL